MKFGTIKEVEKSAELIAQRCDEIKELLLSKNKAYGNSAFEDGEKFGMIVPPEDGIINRIIDKEKRIANEIRLHGKPTKNNIIDLIGYHIIYSIVIEQEDPSGQVIRQ